jgi:hypothetical protein
MGTVWFTMAATNGNFSLYFEIYKLSILAVKSIRTLGKPLLSLNDLISDHPASPNSLQLSTH